LDKRIQNIVNRFSINNAMSKGIMSATSTNTLNFKRTTDVQLDFISDQNSLNIQNT